MSPQTPPPSSQYPVVVRQEPSGQYTAEAVGLPEIRATCSDRAEAIHRIRLVLCQWFASGQLVLVDLGRANPFLAGFTPLDPNDPGEKIYLEELERFRREDLERTLREYEAEEQACSDSSGTPTT
jgi:hypothetical protein